MCSGSLSLSLFLFDHSSLMISIFNDFLKFPGKTGISVFRHREVPGGAGIR